MDRITAGRFVAVAATSMVVGISCVLADSAVVKGIPSAPATGGAPWPRLRRVSLLVSAMLMASCVCVEARQARPEDVTCSLELITLTEQPEVRTPLLAVTKLTNRSADPIEVETGNDPYGALLFLITDPAGAITGPSDEDLSGMGRDITGLKELAPGEAYTTITLVNDSIALRQAGTYRVEAVMSNWMAWKGTHGPTPDKWPALGKAKAEVTLGPGSVESRRTLCDRLALRADAGLRQAAGNQAGFPAVSDPELSKELDGLTSRLLYCVDDEVALPYLVPLAERGWPQAFERIRMIGTPAAVNLLRDLATSRQTRTAAYAAQQLKILGVPAPAESSKPAPQQATVSGTAADLVKRLAAETNATVICAGSPEELAQAVPPAAGGTAERLAAAGYSTDASGDGKLIVLRKHSAAQDARPAASVLVALSRLIAALSPEDLKLADKWGYLRCADLSAKTRPALAETVSLLRDRYAFQGMEVTDTEVPGDLYVNITPTYQKAERWTGPDGAMHLALDDNYSSLFAFPPLGLPAEAKSLAGSPLWWLWPYAADDWAKRPVALPARASTVGQLAEAATRDGKAKLLLGPESQGLAEMPVYVAGDQSDLGHVLWALELLTGRVFQPDTTDPLVITVLPAFAPVPRGGARRPNSPVSELLEALDSGYIAPLRTEAGRVLLQLSAEGDMGRPLNVAWRAADLPNVYSLACGPRTELAGSAAHRDRTLFWLSGLTVCVEKRQGNQGTGSGAVFLPFF